jgi:integrase
VRAWYARLDPDTPTTRAHCYGLLRTIMGTAVTDQKIAFNPCVIRGAGSAKRAVKIRPASLDELAKLVDAMPQRYQAMALLASWCAMRFGELAELRRRDVDLENGVIRIRRGVVRTDTGYTVAGPKSAAGVRDVNVPPHLLPMLAEHLVDHVAPGQDSLLFPAAGGQHLASATLYRHFYAARDAASRPDLRFHDLRHTGAVLAASAGATLAELMARLGHSTPAAALRYQHVADGADRRIAAALSRLAADTP